MLTAQPFFLCEDRASLRPSFGLRVQARSSILADQGTNPSILFSSLGTDRHVGNLDFHNIVTVMSRSWGTGQSIWANSSK